MVFTAKDAKGTGILVLSIWLQDRQSCCLHPEFMDLPTKAKYQVPKYQIPVSFAPFASFAVKTFASFAVKT
jgi:hypothetical protein